MNLPHRHVSLIEPLLGFAIPFTRLRVSVVRVLIDAGQEDEVRKELLVRGALRPEEK